MTVELRVYNDSLVTGNSHLDYGDGKYEHYRLHGVYRRADSLLIIKEDSTISVRLGLFAYNCRGTYTMRLSTGYRSMRLDGRWRDNPDDLKFCPSTTAWLEKPIKRKPVAAKPPPAPRDTMALMPDTIANIEPVKSVEPEVLPTQKPPLRTTKTERVIEIPEQDKDSIKISIADNADIDNDIVSVYKNGEQVISRLKLSHSPSTFYLSLQKDKPITLQMVAESVGSVPPCTARMTITTKKNVYYVDLSSSMSITNSVILVLK